MEQKEGFISARVQRSFSLHTTLTPKFLGLPRRPTKLGAWNASNYGEGVIIGMIDSGIKYDHASFSDKDMPPPPAKWRGRCAFNGKQTCNNKLLGARSFVSTADRGTDLPWEEIYHGSHTSGIAAGCPVDGANVFGQANGTATGIAPRAHLAMYKACGDFCDEGDALAAIDAAIDDGVDVLSISLGPPRPFPFYNDGVALGTFRAIQKGIFVSCSAGNAGPWASTVINDAPWMLTVGASTIDREVRATVKLGNNVELHGQSLFLPKDFHSQQPLPIVDPAATGKNESAAFCAKGSLKNIDVEGKIVICQIGSEGTEDMGQEVKNNGGAAMIVLNYQPGGYTTFAYAHVLPASYLSYRDGLVLKDYLSSTQSPTATISFQGTLIGKSSQTAPRIASFSARGPSLQSPGILKPDIIGPGVDILSAWGVSIDNATKPFKIESGTSMSCPHLSGVAALIKSAHPDWSPAAIKSAIMTTAYTFDLNNNPISTEKNVSATVFDMGSGHVDASRALHPGLVYDIEPDDYIPYLCGLGYSEQQVRFIVQRKVNCSRGITSKPEAELNYPTFFVTLYTGDQMTYTRTVTNVGRPFSTYFSKVSSPEGVAVEVVPSVMRFKEVKEKASYTVTFTRLDDNVTRSSNVGQGSLVWYSIGDDGYKVLSTIVVVFV
ncbi:unnamed protein product [Linum tenue]|nr:unnamed protein product [Linum tenue]